MFTTLTEAAGGLVVVVGDTTVVFDLGDTGADVTEIRKGEDFGDTGADAGVFAVGDN